MSLAYTFSTQILCGAGSAAGTASGGHMAKITLLADFRRKKGGCASSVGDRDIERPCIAKQDIWRRDFSTLDGIIYGLLKVREILGFQLHYYEEWKHYLLQMLDVSYNTAGIERARLLGDVVADFKNFLIEETTPENKEDMALVVLVLELIEKSSALRLDPSGRTQ